MEEFALIKSRVNLNRVNLGIALISDLKVDFSIAILTVFNSTFQIFRISNSNLALVVHWFTGC